MAQKSLDLIERMSEILDEIQPTTVRGVAYQLFNKKLIPDMGRKSVAKVSRLLVKAREDGIIPWEWIVDESRSVEGVNTYKDVADFGESMTRRYRKDFSQHQPQWLMVVSEKSTVSGVIRPVLDRYAVDFLFMHGFGGATAVHDLAELSMGDDQRILEILYIGDYDPSGMYMSEVDLPKRIEKYDGVANVTRVALTREDCDGLPSFDAETKIGDPRHAWFKENYGNTCWELDAMDPNDLRSWLQKYSTGQSLTLSLSLTKGKPDENEID